MTDDGVDNDLECWEDAMKKIAKLEAEVAKLRRKNETLQSQLSLSFELLENHKPTMAHAENVIGELKAEVARLRAALEKIAAAKGSIWYDDDNSIMLAADIAREALK